jgi:hypothetical protein
MEFLIRWDEESGRLRKKAAVFLERFWNGLNR